MRHVSERDPSGVSQIEAAPLVSQNETCLRVRQGPSRSETCPRMRQAQSAVSPRDNPLSQMKSRSTVSTWIMMASCFSLTLRPWAIWKMVSF